MSRRDRLNALKSIIDSNTELNKHDVAAETTMIASHTGTRIRRGVEEKDGRFITDTRDIEPKTSVLVSDDDESSEAEAEEEENVTEIDLIAHDSQANPKRKPSIDPIALQLSSYGDTSLDKAQILHQSKNKKQQHGSNSSLYDNDSSTAALSKTYEKRISKARDLTSKMIQSGIEAFHAQDENPYESAQDAEFHSLVQLSNIPHGNDDTNGAPNKGFSGAIYNTAAIAEITHDLTTRKSKHQEKKLDLQLSKRQGVLSGVNNAENDLLNARLAKDYKSDKLTSLKAALERGPRSH